MENKWEVQRKYLNKNPLLKFVIEKFKKDIIGMVSFVNPRSILDIGCGEGFVTYDVSNKVNCNIIGVDPERGAIDYAIKNHKRDNIDYQVGDVFKLNLKNNSFDLVMSNEVLEHLEEYENALDIMSSLSKKYVLISVPNEPWFRIGNVLRLKYIKRFGNTPGHVNNWTKSKLKRLCLKYGKIEKFRTSTFWNIVLLDISK